MTAPTTSVQLQITERKQKTPLTLARVEIPALDANELLLENVAVSQAMGDTAIVDYDVRALLPTIPYCNGWDAAGTIVAVGKDVKDYSVGDRVLAKVGIKIVPSHGAYQTHTIAVDMVTCKIPEAMSFESASTIPLAFATAFSCVHILGIPGTVDVNFPLPPQPASVAPVLVWGGSSSVGAMAIQILKLSGYRVITTASPKNHEYLKKIGADFTVDYGDLEKAYKQIEEYSEGKLSLVFDSVSRGDTVACSVKVVGTCGGKVVVDYPGAQDTKHERNDIELLYGGAQNIITKPELRNAFKLLEKMLAKDLLVVHPFEVMPDGLLGVNEGWRRGRAKEISAQKLVYRVADTPNLSSV